jgi:hypothetical protein
LGRKAEAGRDGRHYLIERRHQNLNIAGAHLLEQGWIFERPSDAKADAVMG